MLEIPDVNRELSEVAAIFAVFDVLQRKRKLLACTSTRPTSHKQNAAPQSGPKPPFLWFFAGVIVGLHLKRPDGALGFRECRSLR